MKSENILLSGLQKMTTVFIQLQKSDPRSRKKKTLSKESQGNLRKNPEFEFFV